MTLFINGASNFNSFINLGFIVFFVVFTTNENLYRKGSICLSIFIAGFIFVQYVFSLKYHDLSLDSKQKKIDKWFGFYISH